MADLAWTSARPQRVGWYWLRYDYPMENTARCKCVTIVSVTMRQKSWNPDDGEALSCTLSTPEGPPLVDSPGAEWFGPLEPPP